MSANGSEKQRSPWEGFLPKNSLVMARRGVPPAQTSDASQSSDLESAKPDLSSSVSDSFEQIATELQASPCCHICNEQITHLMGEGNPQAQLMLIGEGPSENDEQSSRPFVGESGQLLARMIEAIGLKREQVYLTYVGKCRSSENTGCDQFLFRQINLVQPKVIFAMGDAAAQALLKTSDGIAQIRGKFFDFQGIRVMPTFHPADLLKNPESKRAAWADLQLVAKQLGLVLPAKRGGST